VQAADLRGFTGQPGHPGMARLLTAVESRLGKRKGGSGPIMADRTPSHRPVNQPARRPPWPLIAGGAGVALAALALAFFMGAFDGGKSNDAAPTDPVEAVIGRWRWEGLACGAGPEVQRAGELLTFTMTDTPTFTHAVEKVEGNSLHTIVVEPEAFRGTQYTLTRNANILEVTAAADGKVDLWELCP
jgi:hypothetical protein